jgi:hypothetical protein
MVKLLVAASGIGLWRLLECGQYSCITYLM